MKQVGEIPGPSHVALRLSRESMTRQGKLEVRRERSSRGEGAGDSPSPMYKY